jgi:flagellar motility protein MotE (MotC chaperone)
LKQIRLLPVVIFAAMALLLFKGIGIITNGGYVLTGVQIAAAEGDAGAASSDVPVVDTSPVIGDPSPSMAAKIDAPPPLSSASASTEGSSSSMASGSTASSSAAPSSGASSAAASAEDANACADAGPASSDSSESSSAPAASHKPADFNDTIGNAFASGCAPAPTPVNANGDALPTTKDANGRIVPLQIVEGDNSQDALLARLRERSVSLDKRQADLDMREALVAAAEKKLDDRTQALANLQGQVNALVDQKQAAEDASFKAVVSMYETMKAKDAAKIFDTLDISVLIKVARAMDPRKMSPILAVMGPDPAQQLTTALASVTPVTTVPAMGENLAALPRIVGQ